MKIAIVGNGGAGLPLSIFLKKDHPEFEVTLIDKNEKVGRKLCATGNGKCNILNLHSGEEHYNNPSYMKPLLAEYDFGNLMGYLANIGVVLINEGDYAYPVSKSAPTLVNYLFEIAKQSGVRFLSSTKVLDYESNERITLKTNCGSLQFDKVIFATGGKSSPKLGSDGSLLSIFYQHGYHIQPLMPSLCPIKTYDETIRFSDNKETIKLSTKSISGYRHETKVSLTVDGRLIREEEGEVIFKDDGLSGIVIFNMSAIINHLLSQIELSHQPKIELFLDLFPKVQFSSLAMDMIDAFKKNGPICLEAYFPKEMGQYLLKRALIHQLRDKKDVMALAKIAKSLRFSFKESYGFDASQVSMGGIDINDVNKDLSSKKENNVYFAGEVLDIDGLCGGHNLTWCLISSLLIRKSFEREAGQSF